MKKYLEAKESDRLIIRPLRLDDLPKWEVFFHNPNSLLYFPNFLTGNARKDATAWIQKQLDRYENGNYGLQALIEKSTGNFVGQCGLLTQEVDEITEIEIGYSLLPEYEGKGYASEAAQFFKEYAFENDVTDSLVSVIHKENIPSQKVATRNGMTISKETLFHEIGVYIFRIDK